MKLYSVIDLPPGIIYKGNYYTAHSLLDQQAGTNYLVGTLIDDGLNLPIAKSCGTEDLSHIINVYSEGLIREFREEVIKNHTNEIREMQKSLNVMSGDDFENLVEQFKLLSSWFVEEKNISRKKKRRMDAQFKIGEVQTEFEIDYNFGISELISLIIEEDKENIKDYIIEGEFPEDNWRFDNTYKKFCSIINHIRNFYLCMKQKETYKYENDLFSEMIAIHQGASAIQITSEKENKINILKNIDSRSEKGLTLNLEDTIHFEPIASYSKKEYLGILSALHVMKSVPKMDKTILKGIHPEEIRRIFPIRLGYGKINTGQLDNDGFSINITMHFQPYAIVDIQNLDNAFLMESGKLNFKYKIDFNGKPTLLSYSVTTKDDNSYLHFSIPQNQIKGRPCGFHPVRVLHDFSENSPGYFIPLSQVMWENYARLYFLLTDGLKSDSGFIKIEEMKSHLKSKSIIILDHEFDSRYVPLQQLHEFNDKRPKNKRIYIGYGKAL